MKITNCLVYAVFSITLAGTCGAACVWNNVYWWSFCKRYDGSDALRPLLAATDNRQQTTWFLWVDVFLNIDIVVLLLCQSCLGCRVLCPSKSLLCADWSASFRRDGKHFSLLCKYIYGYDKCVLGVDILIWISKIRVKTKILSPSIST